MIVRLEGQAALTRGALLFVALFKVGGDFLIVTGYGRECIVWDAIFQNRWVEHAYEAVSTTDAVIEEAERLASPVALQP